MKWTFKNGQLKQIPDTVHKPKPKDKAKEETPEVKTIVPEPIKDEGETPED